MKPCSVLYALHPAIGDRHILHLDALDAAGTALARTLDEGHGDLDGVALAIMLDPGTTKDAAQVDQWKQLADLLGGHRVDPCDAEGVVHRRHPAQLFPAIVGVRDAEAAHLAESGCLTSFLFDVVQQPHRVLGEPCVALVGPHRTDQPGRVPGGPAGKLRALEQHDVLPPELHQVIGNAGARDAAANDDGTGLLWDDFEHDATLGDE